MTWPDDGLDQPHCIVCWSPVTGGYRVRSRLDPTYRGGEVIVHEFVVSTMDRVGQHVVAGSVCTDVYVVERAFPGGDDSITLAESTGALLAGVAPWGKEIRRVLAVDRKHPSRGWRKAVLGLPATTRRDVAEARAVEQARREGWLPPGPWTKAEQGAIAEAGYIAKSYRLIDWSIPL